jgi:hypothetical protein
MRDVVKSLVTQWFALTYKDNYGSNPLSPIVVSKEKKKQTLDKLI